MKLRISKKFEPGFTPDTYTLGTDMLRMKSTHLFIAARAWESIELDLSDNIPTGYLGNLNLVSSDIKVRLPETITDKTVVLLAELYPDKAGKLRKQFMFGKPVSEVLMECLIA